MRVPCRLKVLISAYACNPYKGSELGVGWGWVNAIAEHHDLSVMVAEYHRADIEAAVAAESRPGVCKLLGSGAINRVPAGQEC